MRDIIQRVYHRLPAPTRSVVASARGIYLRRWRYGSDTEALVQAALDRDRWDARQWKDWREEQIARLLHRAATRVPYYREYWAERQRRGDRASWVHLENWPVLDKNTVRNNPHAFVCDDRDFRRMFHLHTSGTTGKSLDLWCSRPGIRLWYALFEARCRRWFGLSRSDRWAILGGQLVAPVNKRRPPFWVWNSALNQLYMSSYHLAPDLISHYIAALKGYGIRYLYGYTSSLYELALHVLRQPQKTLNLDVVFTNAEPVFDYQREAIQQAFGCAVRETYGMAEMAAAASECERGSLHWWSDVANVEIANSDDASSDPVPGDLISTGLVNTDMPLVRYRVGDRVTRRTDRFGPEVCLCGRTLPVMASIDGRNDDVLYARDGRRIGRLDPIFKSRLPVSEAQVVQETLERVRVRFVADKEYSPDAGRVLTDRLRSRMGDVEVILEQVSEVPRTANGKFRAVICEIPPEHRPSL